MKLDDDYLAECEKRARKWQGQWTGTAGSIAADSMRLQLERRELLAQIDELAAQNAALRQAVEQRQGVSLPPDLPAEFVEQVKDFEWAPAAPEKPVEFRVERLGASMSPEQLEAVWSAYREKAERVRAAATSDHPEPIATRLVRPSATTLIGLTGPAGCGKNLVASMIPGAVVMQLADPLYAGLAAMLGIPEPLLRHRPVKEGTIGWLGQSPRQLLQTLGTEWGREHVGSDIWLRIAERRIGEFRSVGAERIVIADVRFANEAEWIRSQGGQVWGVIRTPQHATTDHVSEAGLPADLVDAWIDNTGTQDKTRHNVAAVLTR